MQMDPKTGHILFPRRRNRWGEKFNVVGCPPSIVKHLRELLASGETATPRDRSRCKFRFHRLRQIDSDWYTFGFTVRGVTIWGCRWNRNSGSIQLPITFVGPTSYNYGEPIYTKMRVVHAPGTH